MLTARQRELRRLHIGASESPAICGVSPWQTASDIYWRKVEPRRSDESTDAMMTGHRLEKPLIEFACDELGLNGVRRNQFRVAKDDPLLSATFDALGDGFAIECKYVSASGAQYWGQPFTDEVPDHVLIQCQHQAFVGELKEVIVAAAVATTKLEWRIYRIPRHEKLIEAIRARCNHFWKEHVEPRIPPSTEPPPLEILRSRRREDKIIALPDDLAPILSEYSELLRRRKEIEEAIELHQRRLIDALGDATVGRLLDGREITYREQTRRCVDTTELRKRYPDIAAALERVSTFRVLKVKGGGCDE